VTPAMVRRSRLRACTSSLGKKPTVVICRMNTLALESDIPRRTRMWVAAITENPPPLVAEVDGQVLGFVSYGPSSDPTTRAQVGEIYAIYLSPKCWGEGIGKAMHDEAISRLRARRFHEATLWVLESNMRTRRWYERQRWVPDGSERFEEIGGLRTREMRYRLSLAGSQPG
jgi:ribosomal protein S18 acetylase RimI-like enzyme